MADRPGFLTGPPEVRRIPTGVASAFTGGLA